MAQKKPKEKESEAPEAVDEEPSAQEAAEEAIEHAQDAVDTLKAETTGAEGVDGTMPLPDFADNGPAGGQDSAALALLRDVNLQVKVELGRTLMYVEDVLRLNENSVVELDKLAGDPVDVFVNDRHVARGEVLVVNDAFCVRVSEIIQPIGDE
ncbi:MAG: flagellar motor switch protein FliN [Planctomycetota bacterium]|jgi:flagellar motor switch protein FliN/FliY